MCRAAVEVVWHPEQIAVFGVMPKSSVCELMLAPVFVVVACTLVGSTG
jgi:hypothetical protein